MDSVMPMLRVECRTIRAQFLWMHRFLCAVSGARRLMVTNLLNMHTSTHANEPWTGLNSVK